MTPQTREHATISGLAGSGGGERARTRRALALVACTAGLVLGAAASAAVAPTTFVRDVVSQVRETVDEQTASGSRPESVSEAIAEQIVPHVDMTLVSRLVLGRHWREADAAQRERFREEFRRLLVRSYAAAVRDNANARIEYLSESIRERDGGDQAVVRTRVAPEAGPPIEIDYRLARRGGEWHLYDVVVDGVSMITNYRRQFDARIDAAGMSGFLDELEARNRPASSG